MDVDDATGLFPIRSYEVGPERTREMPHMAQNSMSSRTLLVLTHSPSASPQ